MKSLTLMVLVLAGTAVAQIERPQLSAPPKAEVRAVWITTVLGLDWPKSTDPAEQQRSLHEMVEKLHAARFNTIFFQVRSRADAMYRSGFEPWSQQLTGTLGQDPGWDPLEFLIDAAHARGIEVHAWFNTFYARSGKSLPPESKPRHAVLAHPQWVKLVGSDWWFDPGLPQVRRYILDVAMDLIRRYDVDGIHFDFIRYPGRRFPDDETYRMRGAAAINDRDQWRRENINAFVRAFYDSATSLKPMLKIGSAPIGIYENVGGSKGLQGYAELFQDSRRWIQEGKHDYVAPQLYWPAGGNPDFAELARDWIANGNRRHVYAGLGVYKPEVFEQTPMLVDLSRSLGAQGCAFFRYEHIARALEVGGRYRTLANVPSMLWKDPVPPNPPSTLVVASEGDDAFSLRWSAPRPAADGDGARSYNIYRSTHRPVDVSDAANLVAIVLHGGTAWTDTLAHPTAPRYYYAVTSLDKGNNESAPVEESVTVPEIAELFDRLAPRFTLGRNFPDPASRLVFIPYVIGSVADVNLTITDYDGAPVLDVVSWRHEPGRYVVAADVSKLRDGNYYCNLIAGDRVQRRLFRVDN